MTAKRKSSVIKGPITVLRARVVLPISRPPISDGAIVIAGNKIVSVGPWTDVAAEHRAAAVDLGEVILLPGLVNAHCHLDYTAMAGLLTPPRSFVSWLMDITVNKDGWIYSHYAESWLAGTKMLLRTGTTTVGDIEMIPELLPEAWTATPLRVHSFIEMTGVKSRRPPPEIIDEALQKIASIEHERNRFGLSPHAPYSTTPELLRLAAQTARKHDLRVVTHVAESGEEFEMFTRGSGKMFDWLNRGGRDMSDRGLGSPVQHLERHGLLGENLLAIHVNYLAPGDVALLAKRKVNIVHCPRSHAYFRHQKFPLAELAKASINICLGTDSLASVFPHRKQLPELNMFDEMRELSDASPGLAPETIVQMATVNAALAMGMKNKIGELRAKSFADVIAIPFDGKIAKSHEAIVHHRGDVAASMIDGQWAVAPNL